VSEFTARIVSAFSGVALVGVLHAWLALRWNKLAAWLGTVMLLATFGFLHAARVGEMDVLLALGCCVALIGLAEVKASALAWYVFWAGFAVALMTKGAASGTLLVVLAGACTMDRELLRRVRGHFAAGFALFLAVVLPWHLAMLHWFGKAFVAEYFGLHVLARATTQLDGHITSWWYYLLVLAVSAAPFVLLYPVALRDGFRDSRLEVFALFAVVVVVLFSCVQTRLPHYIVPAYPALSVLVAVWLGGYLQERAAAMRVRFAVAGVLVFVAAVFVTARPRKNLHSPRLANGIVTPDNREQVALLRQVFGRGAAGLAATQAAATPGLLLSWRVGTYNPIPTTVFYSDRVVQQVEFEPVAAGVVWDKYAFDPVEMRDVVGVRPRLILLDRRLLASLPAEFAYKQIAASGTLEIGTISQTAAGTAKWGRILTRTPVSR
jgi:hypothetical protein